MTATVEAPTPVARRGPRPRRRPVARFVLALAAVGLVLAGVAWSGVLWPQVRLQPAPLSAVESVRPAPDGGTWVDDLVDADEVAIDVTNLGGTTVEVRSVTWELARPHEVAVVPDAVATTSGRLAGFVARDRLEPFAPFRVGAGETRTIVLISERPCPEAVVASPLPDVEVVVAAPTGRERTLVWSEGAGPTFGRPACP